MKLTTIEVRGRSFEVDVNINGEFTSSVDGQCVAAPSLDALREKITRITKNVKIAVPFVIWDKDLKMRRGVCIGRHAGNSNLLVKYDDAEKPEQVSSWELNRAIDPSAAAEYLSVCEQYGTAVTAMELFTRKHTIDVKRLVDQALEAAYNGGAS